MKYISSKRGFTLVELLVVVTVLVTLAGVVAISVQRAAAIARDEVRYNDLQTLKTGMILYAEANGGFPRESDGFSSGLNGEICINCGKRNSILNNTIEDYVGEKMESPKHDFGANGNYYYYDGSRICNDLGSDQAVLFATMETTKYDNVFTEIAAICGGTNTSKFGNEGTFGGQKTKMHVIILGPSAG